MEFGQPQQKSPILLMMPGWGVPFELTGLFHMNFRIVKFTDFELEDKTKGTVYTVAHSGRVLQVSTLHFEAGELTAAEGKLTIKGDIEVVKRPYVNKLGETVQGLSIMPKFGLSLSEV